MGAGLSLIDWAIVAVIAAAFGGGAVALAIRLARDHVADALQAMRAQLSATEARLASVEQRLQQDPRRVAAMPPAPAPSRSMQPAPARSAPPVQGIDAGPRRSIESLTRDAAQALASLDAFRQFAQVAGGRGLVVPPGTQMTEPAPGPDPVYVADLWAVQLDGDCLLFPGFNLRRGQSALLADSGRMATERLGWLFDIAAGEQLVATRPAIQRNGAELARGSLTLPLLPRSCDGALS